MSNQFFIQGPEDEMEFMPIIPLNEDDSEDNDTQVIPRLEITPCCVTATGVFRRVSPVYHCLHCHLHLKG